MMKDNLDQIRANIEKAAALAGVDPAGITMVAVSKTKPVSLMREAYDLGVRHFGENRVQEYLEKKDGMPADVQWNIIGRLQTNKIKYIINNIWMLHSLDRLNLARELQIYCDKSGCMVDALLEVNTAAEDTKSGFFVHELEEAAREISQMDKIHVRGLMTVAPYTEDKEYLRGVFAQTKQWYDKIAGLKLPGFDFKYLSMGMSNDYYEAILEGSNMVRIGFALFGDRGY